MRAVDRVLWYVESRLSQPIQLADLAGAAGVTPHHLARAFLAVTGHPPMRYVRRRRLTRAAAALAAGAPDILNLAFDAGYGSHEAFTRAFRDTFGRTPEDVRRNGLNGTDLQEAIMLQDQPEVDLTEPRLVRRGAFTVVGMGGTYSHATAIGVPQLWERFRPHIGHIPGELPDVAYGLCMATEDGEGFQYVAGVEVRPGSDLPAGMTRHMVPEGAWLVFEHRGHVGELRHTMRAIFSDYLPTAPHRHRAAPDFERYDARFDVRTGTGVVEIWVPVEG